MSRAIGACAVFLGLLFSQTLLNAQEKKNEPTEAELYAAEAQVALPTIQEIHNKVRALPLNAKPIWEKLERQRTHHRLQLKQVGLSEAEFQSVKGCPSYFKLCAL